MNGVELFLLGRALMKVGEQALPDTGDGSHATVLVVLQDVFDHPDAAISEIAGRTGFPQSAVSMAVARLREAGSLVARTDPRDRRRTLLRRATDVSPRVAQVRTMSIDEAIGRALGTDDAAEIREVVHALESVAQRMGLRTM
ncbi:MarR family transcriptional regulator [Nocardia sp. NPDC059180]|uniref:MarR family transcriptional regulator n=1 Tax=Nocardia sp. NPDC059180 TaxID=3346761 RepID=UPI00368E5CBD